jgi:nucleotide-binding universal stress UspA family protein
MTTSRYGIVAGYDGSPGSNQALRWAVEETQARDCMLTVCLAWAPQYLAMLDEPAVYDLARKKGEQALASGLRYARSVLGDGSVVPLLARDAAAPVLCEQSGTAEMVVLGARGQGGVAGLALGSVPWQVAGHARGPVVIVRGRWRQPNHPSGPVVAAADGSAASEDVIRFALGEAELRRAPLLAVCALADAPGSLGCAHRIEEDFARVLRLHEKEHPELTVLRQVSAGSPRTALLDAAAGAQLLVVGSRGRGGFKGMRLGSVAQAVIHHASCPVAVITSGEEEASRSGRSHPKA